MHPDCSRNLVKLAHVDIKPKEEPWKRILREFGKFTTLLVTHYDESSMF